MLANGVSCKVERGNVSGLLDRCFLDTLEDSNDKRVQDEMWHNFKLPKTFGNSVSRFFFLLFPE